MIRRKELPLLIASIFCHMTATSQEIKSTQMKSDTFKMEIKRTFNTRLDRVWDAWTSSESVKNWWGPEGFTCPLANIRFKEGDASLVCMRSPEGFEIFNSWTYTRIDVGKTIQFISHFTDKGGKKINASDIGLPPGIPFEVPHTLTFKDLGKEKTEMTIVETGYGSPEVVEMSKAGMASVLDKLATYLGR